MDFLCSGLEEVMFGLALAETWRMVLDHQLVLKVSLLQNKLSKTFWFIANLTKCSELEQNVDDHPVFRLSVRPALLLVVDLPGRPLIGRGWRHEEE